jgi:hypothetical protein
MGTMEKTFRLKSIILGYIIIVLLLSLVSCGTNKFWRQVAQNRTYANRIYDKYLKAYGNVSMIDPEGNFSVIWYYKNKRIYITRILKSEIVSTEDYRCDTILNIKEYQKECYPEVIDAEGFKSSYYDENIDSLYIIYIGLDVTNLKLKGSSCPVLKELREHIIRYKLWVF